MAFNSNDLYTENRYFLKNPTWDEEDAAWKANKINRLLRANNIMPESIVEIGCGTGGILKELSQLNPDIKNLEGFDISPQAISLAKKNESEKIRFHNTDFFLSTDENPDVLLVIDVVEHVDDYYGFLNKIKSRGKYFVFHIPLDLSCRNILKPHSLAVQRNNVGHIHYFTRDIIEWSLQDTGFEIIDWFYTKPLPDTSPVKGIKKQVKKFLRNISFAINKNWSARLWGDYSILLLAK